jgi:transposase
MFVRQKKNKSGVISVQVIDKSSGKYKLHKTIGSSSLQSEVDILLSKAKEYVNRYGGQSVIDFAIGSDRHFYTTLYQNIQQIQLLGPEMILGKLFDQIGFNKIQGELFRHLVISRLVYPVSKLKTIDYLEKYKGVTIHVNEIYRFMDKLHSRDIEQVKAISFDHTVNVLGKKLGVVFYDVTTLYFEAADEDDLRKTGFSKDGKHNNPQIVLGLLVAENGYPLDYEVFEGNKFEGHTMLPVIEAFKNKYKTQQPIVVADAGLMSNKNLNKLQEAQYGFIIGARIKNESETIKSKIMALTLSEKQYAEIRRDDGLRMIVQYSTARATNDAKNRLKGLERLKKQLAAGKLTKKHINNKGYNKYLKLEGEITITIDEQKYQEDAKWDGLKGYITNTVLDAQTVMDYYRQLWQVERTFRITKTDLRIRPIYHYKKRRIEAHICIAFAACKLYKELERQLKEKKSAMSAEKAIDTMKTIFGLVLTMPQSKEEKLMILDKNQEQKKIIDLFR